MHIDWWTLGLQAVNVLVLIWLLGRFLFRPVAEIMRRRQEEARRLLDEAEAARADAATERRKAAAAEGELAAARSRGLQEAAAAAEAERARLRAEVEAEGARLRESLRVDLERERQSRETLLRRQAGALAVDIAGRLLARLPETVRVTPFLPGIEQSLRALPEATRAGLLRAPLRLSVPRPLQPEEAAACERSLRSALGEGAACEAAVDPGVVAGVELEGPGLRLRNSVRGDLERVAGELAREEADG